MAKSRMVKPLAIKVLLMGLILLTLIPILSQFNIVDLSSYQTAIITLIAIAFVGVEIGVVQMLKGKRAMKTFNGMQWFGIVVIGLAFIGVITSLFGMTIPFLDSIKGVVNIGLIVFIIYEVFN